MAAFAAIQDGGYRMVSHLGNGWIEAEALDSGIPVVFATTPDGKHRMPAAGRGGLIA